MNEDIESLKKKLETVIGDEANLRNKLELRKKTLEDLQVRLHNYQGTKYAFNVLEYTNLLGLPLWTNTKNWKKNCKKYTTFTLSSLEILIFLKTSWIFGTRLTAHDKRLTLYVILFNTSRNNNKFSSDCE